MKEIVIKLNNDTFNELRKTSIHSRENIETVIERIVEMYYDGKK